MSYNNKYIVRFIARSFEKSVNCYILASKYLDFDSLKKMSNE